MGESAYKHTSEVFGFADREAAEKWITSFPSQSLFSVLSSFYVQTQAKSCIKGTERRFHWRSWRGKPEQRKRKNKTGKNFSASPEESELCEWCPPTDVGSPHIKLFNIWGAVARFNLVLRCYIFIDIDQTVILVRWFFFFFGEQPAMLSECIWLRVKNGHEDGVWECLHTSRHIGDSVSESLALSCIVGGRVGVIHHGDTISPLPAWLCLHCWSVRFRIARGVLF